MKTFVRWLWFALMGLAAEGFADEGEFIVHVVNGVATVTAKLAPNTVAYGWNGTRVTYIPAFESTRMFWDAPKSQDHEFEYMPWGLIDLTVKISGKDDFLFQIDFRDINWSTNQESYPGADTYLYIDAAAYTFKLKYHYDDSTIVLSQHGYQIWTLWGKERDDGEFGTPVLLRNQFEDESHAGGTLSLYGINIPSNDYGVTEKGATVADIGTNNERFQVSNEQRKHLNWNGDHPDHLLTGSVGVPQYPFSEIAIFRPLRPAVIATQLVEGGGGDTIMFHDPWFLEADGSQPDTFLPFGSPYSPTGARNQQTGGVFLGRDYNIPGRPYYSVGAPVSQTVGGVESSFLHWSAVSAGLRSPDKDTSAVVFNEAGATVTALYKGHLRSSISSATASNSQSKIGFIDGKYHIVYESAGDIWYGYSTDNGQTWTGEFLVSDGTGHSRQPSLAVSWSSSGPHVAIVWEWFDGESYIIHLRGRYVDGSWSAPNPIWGGFCDPDYDGATPVIAMEDDFQVVAWRVKRSDEWEIPGIHVWINNGNDPVLVAGTGLNSVHPSVAVPACGQSKGRFGLVWSQSGEIYYRPFWYDLEEERLHSYSTELASEGSSLIELDYPSLVFISSNGWYPSVAWQGVHHVTYISSVQVRRKTISGWGTIQQYSLGGGDEIFHPSLTRHESPDTSLAMVMEGGGDMFLAKCTSSWAHE